MKKIILLFTICTLLLSSCKDKKNDGDPMAVPATMFLAVMDQSHIALDPFHVAFRLNALLTEAEASYISGELVDNINPVTKIKLFGSATTISYNSASQMYTVNFTSDKGEDDRIRSGKLLIEVGNFPTLATTNAYWRVITEPNEHYTMEINGTYISVALDEAIEPSGDGSGGPGIYTIRNTGASQWTVGVANFRSWIEYSFQSFWAAEYVVTQSGASQLPEDIGNDTYSIRITATNSQTLHWSDLFTVVTNSPLQYDPSCSWKEPVGGGDIRITANQEDTPNEYCTVKWLQGEDPCDVKYMIRYQGMEEVYE